MVDTYRSLRFSTIFLASLLLTLEDSDCRLVSSKNLSEILPPNGWRPGPGKVGQGGLKFLHL